MTTPKRDVRRFRMISVAPTVVEPRGRRLVFDPQTFQGVRPGAPVLADHVNASGRVAGRILSAWIDRNAGAVLGNVEIYGDDIEAAAHVRRLLNAGHKGASIRHDGVVEPSPDRIGPNLVKDWGIAHLACVAEGADESAGQLSANDGTVVYFDLELMPQEDDMTQPNFDLATVLPQLTDAIAAGVRQGNAATDTERASGGGPNERDAHNRSVAARTLSAWPRCQEIALDLAMGKITDCEATFRDKLTSASRLFSPAPIDARDSPMRNSPITTSNAVVQGVHHGQRLL